MGWFWKEGQRPTMDEWQARRAERRAAVRSESEWIFALRVVGLVAVAVVAGVLGRYGWVLLAAGALVHTAWLRFKPREPETETSDRPSQPSER